MEKQKLNLENRYKEYWINEMEEPKNYFFSEKEIEEYVKLFPRGTKVLMTKVELDCCDNGHTFREIMGFDEFICYSAPKK